MDDLDCYFVEKDHLAVNINSYYPVDVLVSSIADVHPFFRYFDAPPYVRCLVNSNGTTLIDVRGFVQVLTNDAFKTAAIVERLMCFDSNYDLYPVDTVQTILRDNCFRVTVGARPGIDYVALPIKHTRRLHKYVQNWYK